MWGLAARPRLAVVLGSESDCGRGLDPGSRVLVLLRALPMSRSAPTPVASARVARSLGPGASRSANTPAGLPSTLRRTAPSSTGPPGFTRLDRPTRSPTAPDPPVSRGVSALGMAAGGVLVTVFVPWLGHPDALRVPYVLIGAVSVVVALVLDRRLTRLVRRYDT